MLGLGFIAYIIYRVRDGVRVRVVDLIIIIIVTF